MIFLVLKMILNSADRRCFSLIPISCLTKWPFFKKFRHHGVSYKPTDYIICVFWALHRQKTTHLFSCFVFFLFIYLFSYLSELRAMVRICGFPPSLSLSLVFFPSPFFIFSLHQLCLKSHLFAFSYAMVAGIITSWQETSCQLEGFYLWQLLSNWSSSWTVTTPTPSH